MAYDKVVDSAALDADILAVADAIREKSGVTGSMTFPTGFVSAIEQISVLGGMTGEVHDISITSDVAQQGQALLTENEFIVKNGKKTGFVAILFKKEPAVSGTNGAVYSIFHGNVNIGASDKAQYGNATYDSGFMGIKDYPIDTSIYDSVTQGSGVYLYVSDNGYLVVTTESSYVVKAGTYKVILLCFDI